MKGYKTYMTIVALLVTVSSLSAQSGYLLCTYLATINGTSNIHAWSEKIGEISGNGDIKQNIDKSFTLRSFKIIMQVNSIKSDEGPILDNGTYKALKADKFPAITFVLTEPVDNIPFALTPYSITGKGWLTVAGVTRDITMPIKIAFSGEKKITIDGEQQLKMTDYGIDPPTMFFGMIKTGNIITISFKTTFLTANQ
jgi:polyisoprenoid-binding protein YceI